MSRLILLLIFGLVAALYFPDSRQVVLDAAEPVITPVFRWQTSSELEEIYRDLRRYELEHYNQLPEKREWVDWLDRHYAGSPSEDAWGTKYHLLTRRDSFYIVSYGPDRIYGTADDLNYGGLRASRR